MSLSTTSLAFLRELNTALAGVEVDGPEPVLGSAVYLIGNGGSAAICAHIANDLVKMGHPAHTPDVASLSCLANDAGWGAAMAYWIDSNARPGSTVIAISSSGRSNNIVWACGRAIDMNLVTLTGFDTDNPVRKLGHTNYWVPSHNYGIVECAHLAILHSIVNPGEV